MNKKVFIGVAWPYVNGDIHIGHLAGYLFPADIYARYRRFKGDDVLMVSGSDCYGTPITVAAEKRGISYKDLVDEYHPQRIELFKDLKLSYDLFTQTTTDNHRKVVQDFFRKGLESGVIYIDSSDQFYDEDNQKFLPDRYVEGECPHCGYKESRSDQCDNCGKVLSPEELINPISKLSGKPVILKATQHYYYDWKQGEEFLMEYVPDASESWRKWSVSETNKWLKEGLTSRAITRDIEWGIPIPEDIDSKYKIENSESKRIYVWFEAVIGYLSASIEATKDYESWWKNPDAEHVYYMGKDNLVFHTLFWPFQLHAYDSELQLPDTVIVNNFLNLGGQKFSKSRGVIIDSRDIVEEFGLEAVKFYLTSIMPENTDSNFVQSDFEEKVNSVLVANLGNFVYRTSKLLQKASDIDYTKTDLLNTHIEEVSQLLQQADQWLSKNEFKRYLETILDISGAGNKALQHIQPWGIKDSTYYTQTISTFLPYLVGLSIAMKPIFFESSQSIQQTLGIATESWPEDFSAYFESVREEISFNFDNLKPLFKKIENK
jgi:methionyl-tRNA synthetase